MGMTSQKGLEQYDIRLLLAMLKAVEGRKDFFKWLIDNGYRDLAAFSNSIRGDEVALYCLVQMKKNWLAILSNATGGDKTALKWVREHCTEPNYHFAKACTNDVDAAVWLKKHDQVYLMMLAKAVSVVNDTQAAEKAGPYVMSF